MGDFKQLGILWLLVGPSGTGKTTQERKVGKELGGIEVLVSETTRQPRDGEQHGVAYYFRSPEDLQGMLERGDLLEHVVYRGNQYGLSRQEVESKLAKGDAITVVEGHGAEQLKRLFECRVVFFLPPDEIYLLENRMIERGDNPELVKSRLTNIDKEMAFIHLADICVDSTNTIEDIFMQIREAILDERVKRQRKLAADQLLDANRKAWDWGKAITDREQGGYPKDPAPCNDPIPDYKIKEIELGGGPATPIEDDREQPTARNEGQYGDVPFPPLPPYLHPEEPTAPYPPLNQSSHCRPDELIQYPPFRQLPRPCANCTTDTVGLMTAWMEDGRDFCGRWCASRYRRTRKELENGYQMSEIPSGAYDRHWEQSLNPENPSESSYPMWFKSDGRPTQQAIHMTTAFLWAMCSSCIRAHAGCVITEVYPNGREVVRSHGYNGGGIGQADNECLHGGKVPGACGHTHAEDNAGWMVSPTGLPMHAYITFQPCLPCAKKLTSLGLIRKVFIGSMAYRASEGIDYLRTAGVQVEFLPPPDGWLGDFWKHGLPSV